MKAQVQESHNFKDKVMTKATAILCFLLPIACLSQQESRVVTTTNTTDCPTWENKKQPSKAEYFQSLRTSSGKTKDQQIAYLNKKELKPQKQPGEKPELERSYIPAFSSGDAIMENKSIVKKDPEIQEEKEIEKLEVVEKQTSETKVQSSVSNERTKKKKKKVKTNCAGTNGVNTSKKNNTKCPAF